MQHENLSHSRNYFGQCYAMDLADIKYMDFKRKNGIPYDVLGALLAYHKEKNYGIFCLELVDQVSKISLEKHFQSKSVRVEVLESYSKIGTNPRGPYDHVLKKSKEPGFELHEIGTGNWKQFMSNESIAAAPTAINEQAKTMQRDQEIYVEKPKQSDDATGKRSAPCSDEDGNEDTRAEKRLRLRMLEAQFEMQKKKDEEELRIMQERRKQDQEKHEEDMKKRRHDNDKNELELCIRSREEYVKLSNNKIDPRIEARYREVAFNITMRNTRFSQADSGDGGAAASSQGYIEDPTGESDLKTITELATMFKLKVNEKNRAMMGKVTAKWYRSKYNNAEPTKVNKLMNGHDAPVNAFKKQDWDGVVEAMKAELAKPKPDKKQK